MQLVYNLRKETKREISEVHGYLAVSAAAPAGEWKGQKKVLSLRALGQLETEIELGSMDRSVKSREGIVKSALRSGCLVAR